MRMEFTFEYTMSDYERALWLFADDRSLISFRQDDYMLKILTHWTPIERFSLAVGLELRHEKFGLKSPGYPDQEPNGFFGDQQSSMPRWNTEIWSPLFEMQWNINEKMTTFIGGRIDKHSYTDYLYSPRFALVFTPNANNTLKFMFSRSNRLNDFQILKLEHDAGGTSSEVEVVNNFEKVRRN